MNNKIKIFFLIAIFIYVSFHYAGNARNLISTFTNISIQWYLSASDYISETIAEHFYQADEIKRLKEENEALEKTATLSMAFANKLNSFLEDKNHQLYKPNIKLAQILSYVNLSDYNRVWINLDDFNKSKIYGLIRKGTTAGIVVSNNGKPMGILQGDSKCIFSVFIGKNKIPGVAMGNKSHMNIKYIPQWMSPKIGDEVQTSGLDKIFFGGIPVGKVTRIIQESSYQTAVVKPYANPQVPAFYYVILKP